jgi:non-ribosomal peptide synthetase component F
MPTDFPRPKVQSFAGFSTDFQLSKSLTGKVRAFILERGVTLYMFLLAAYNILLSRWGGQEDIVVGTPIAGRPHADLENIIGMFVNTLPMRNHPPGEKTFREFLEEVKLNSLNAYENQDYQFEELVNRLGIKPDPGRHPLFDTMFVVQNIDISTRGYKKKIKNISFRQYQFEENITQFDIITHAYEGDKHGVISFKLRYCVKLFKQKTIERFIGFFKEIITAVVDNPNIKLKEIKLSHSLFDQELNVLKQELGDFEF